MSHAYAQDEGAVAEQASVPPVDDFTPRQGQVLEAALDLLVEGGERAITTAGLARAANCSKESLYKWFGDRDGILAAMVAFQASKVRAPAERPTAQQPLEAFRCALISFGIDLLSVLAGSTSLALNRLAIGQTSREDTKLADLLVARGRNAVAARARALLEAGRRAGHLRFDETQRAFETLYGLIICDMHVRLLLGEAVPAASSEGAMASHVSDAVDRFLRLHGAGQLI